MIELFVGIAGAVFIYWFGGILFKEERKHRELHEKIEEELK